jgi:probable phosphoglycerate mutase
MNILLVRHGETPWNREGRYQGRTDVALSAEGETQARSLGDRLSLVPLTRAVSSPLGRARRTAEIVLDRRPLALDLDDGLVEISHGGWEGKLSAEVRASDPAMFATWRGHPGPDVPAGPGAESLGQVLDRAWAALGRATAGLGPDENVLVAAHDAVNRVILCRVLGLPLERVWSFRQSPATLNVLSGTTLDDLAVVRLNDSEHVAPLLHEAQHLAL